MSYFAQNPQQFGGGANAGTGAQTSVPQKTITRQALSENQFFAPNQLNQLANMKQAQPGHQMKPFMVPQKVNQQAISGQPSLSGPMTPSSIPLRYMNQAGQPSQQQQSQADTFSQFVSPRPPSRQLDAHQQFARAQPVNPQMQQYPAQHHQIPAVQQQQQQQFIVTEENVRPPSRDMRVPYHAGQQQFQAISLENQSGLTKVVPPSLNIDASQKQQGGILQLAQVRPELLVQQPSSQQQIQIQQQQQQQPTPQLRRNSSLQTLSSANNNGYTIQQQPITQQTQQQFTVQNEDFIGMQQQQPPVIEKIIYVNDPQQVEDLQGRIRVLLDNIQELNRSSDEKDTEISELREKVLEVEHLQRLKVITQEENDSLKLTIEEWQKRYSVLEMQLIDKQCSTTSFIPSSYNSYDSMRVLNSLKIKQEENEALKTRIARLEMGMGSEKLLREDVQRLNEIVELKNRQCEEWRVKYQSLETKHAQQIEKLKQMQLTSTTKTDRNNNQVQVNDVTPNISAVFADISKSPIRGDDRFQPIDTNNDSGSVTSKDATIRRGRSPHLQYNTAALFTKKRPGVTSPDNSIRQNSTPYY